MHLLGHPSALDALGAAARARRGLRRAHVRLAPAGRPSRRWCCGSTTCSGRLRCCSTCSSRSPRHLADLPRADHHHLPARRARASPTGRRRSIRRSRCTCRSAPLSRVRGGRARATPPPGVPLPERTVQSISARAGGNPLFLTELARLAAECPDDPDGPELPGVAASADRRPPRPAHRDRSARCSTTPRSSASKAASPALRSFAGELGQPFDVTDVDVLVEHGLIVRDGGRWQFRSRRRPRGRLRHAHQAGPGAAPCRRRPLPGGSSATC